MVRAMRQHCEACTVTPKSAKLIGVMLGEHDVLLCAEHALLALDTEMRSLAELKELMILLADDAPAAASTKRSGGAVQPARHSAA